MNKDKKEKSRKLTPAEQRRLESFQKISEEFTEQGYRMTDLTVGLVWANIFAILIGIPIFIGAAILFFIYNRPFNEGLSFSLSVKDEIIFFTILIVLIVVHELIHGVTWGLFSKNHFHDIEFGFIKEYLTPYCTCKTPLLKYQYIVGALTPLIFLGLIPLIISIFTGFVLLFLLGAVMTLSAGGDILIVIQILKYKSSSKDILYMDHPTQGGGVIFEK